MFRFELSGLRQLSDWTKEDLFQLGYFLSNPPRKHIRFIGEIYFKHANELAKHILFWKFEILNFRLNAALQ